MPTLENIQQLQELGKDLWSNLNLTQVNETLKGHMFMNNSAFQVLEDSTIQILLGIEYLKQQETKTNESV